MRACQLHSRKGPDFPDGSHRATTHQIGETIDKAIARGFPVQRGKRLGSRDNKGRVTSSRDHGADTSLPVAALVPGSDPVGLVDQAGIGAGQAIHPRHFIVTEREIEDGKIFGQPLNLGRARNGDDVVLLHQPAQGDLRSAAVMRLGDGLDDWVADHPPQCDRAIGGDGHAAPPQRSKHDRLVQIGMIFQLLAGEGLAGQAPGLLKQLGGEIGEADMACQTLALDRVERTDCLCQRNLWIGPMQQKEVNPPDAELSETILRENAADRFRPSSGATPWW